MPATTLWRAIAACGGRAHRLGDAVERSTMITASAVSRTRWRRPRPSRSRRPPRERRRVVDAVADHHDRAHAGRRGVARTTSSFCSGVQSA